MLIGVIFLSCTEHKYKRIGQEIIDGKVSAVESTCFDGVSTFNPSIWVQDARETKKVELPFEYNGRFKVGDTCLLIIEKYKENDTE
jgi:hypothetical protein